MLRIDLIDGEALCFFLKHLELGAAVRKRVVEDIAVDPTIFEAV